MRAQRMLTLLMEEHSGAFGCAPSPALCQAVKGALECGLTVSDFWICFDGVAADFRKGADFTHKGGADAEIIHRLRKVYRKKAREKQDGM